MDILYKQFMGWRLFRAMLLLIGLSVISFAQTNDAPKLPEGLTDSEMQQIRKDQRVKGQVEAVLRVANARLLQTLKQVQAVTGEESFKQLELYLALLTYADETTRRLPANEIKERNKVLKLLEQAIFKQQRTFEGARQEMPFEQREASEKLLAAIKRIRLRALNDGLGNGEFIKQ